MWNSSENMGARSTSFREEGGEEEELKCAAIERLPTYRRVRRGIITNIVGDSVEVDMKRLQPQQQKLVLDRFGNVDSQQLFARIKERCDAVALEIPKVEIRFQNLTVESLVHVGSRALPTIPNFILNVTEAILSKLWLLPVKRRKFSILDDINGIIRPSRLTLLLGPPSSGKTTLLMALAGRIGSDLQMTGKISYNGHNLHKFIPQTTSSYVSQQDWHVAEMTVRETLEFARRCQGVGVKYDMLLELLRREKASDLRPDEDVDMFMKAFALKEQESGLMVEHVLKILGLDLCADTVVGDEMLKGISGGQKKRLTTGEILVGPARVLLMDEISTGLDSSTTYQIIKYLKHMTCALGGTTVISLLQPGPETYELFDDVMILCEGQIVYQGPRDSALGFFELMGFHCPERKNVADFLQEVTSKKDQGQYWSAFDRPYQYIPVNRFSEAFNSHIFGRNMFEKLTAPVDRQCYHPAALSNRIYGVKRTELLKTSLYYQILLMRRNSFIYVFRFFQLVVVAFITMSVFLRTSMHHRTIDDGSLYVGALYFAMVIILFNGFMEVSMLVCKLPVIYKLRDLHFYPCWAYTIPSWLLSIPISLIESGFWVAFTYFLVGFDPEASRFFKQFLLFFFLHQMSIGLFRVMGSLGRNMIVANTFGSFAMLVIMALGGFIVSRDRIPAWWIWGFWISPLMYAQNSASVNELLGRSWSKKASGASELTLGKEVLNARSLFSESRWYWIGIGAMCGYVLVFNILFTLFLSYLNPLGKRQAVLSEEELQERERRRHGERENSVELKQLLRLSDTLTGEKSFKQRGMILPFQPLSMAFSNINYFVEAPMELKRQGLVEDRLQLLVNVTGAFRPGVLTALVGVSGAGKTTLMDVLSGRKTGGIIEGHIYISGFPKKQETFARVSGYCEQNDVHSPCLTVLESLIFSAWMRLPLDVDKDTRRAFVEEVMELVELNSLSGALVGLPGVDGLSTEQRKRLTIAVELVSNPSIVFMDEPTSGLDARSAAIVMRTVRNIVNTGRTIVCTIHQPSIDIFDSFDELLFMKRGGALIYAGPLGPKSSYLTQFFEAVEGVPKIKPGCNPATWMLEVTSPIEESRLGVDFAEIYRRSSLFQCNKELVEEQSKPSNNMSKDLNFATKYPQPYYNQFFTCLWKQHLSYWRNPQYTAVRFFYTVVISLMLGSICWRFGSKRETQQDIYNAMGSIYLAVLFIGVTNASAVQPVVSVERFVSYRERAARMYPPLPFAFAQVAVELPYVLVQAVIYGTVFYSMAAFEWEAGKFLWYVFFMYTTMLYFTFYGMMTAAMSPNHNVAAIVSSPAYIVWNLFSGFMISYKRIPRWWRWYYWSNPVAWSLYGLLTSQYGEGDGEVELSNKARVRVQDFLNDSLGYRHDFIGVAALVAVGFCLLFALVFALSIKTFNFQKR